MLHSLLTYVCRYLFKNLGVQVSDSPLTVRLLFEPSGRAVDESGQYYTQEKANNCVVCGSNGSYYVRKNVVPHEYRKHFPGKPSIKWCWTFVMLSYVGLSRGVHDPFHAAWQSGSVCVRIPSFFQLFCICTFACDVSEHV